MNSQKDEHAQACDGLKTKARLGPKRYRNAAQCEAQTAMKRQIFSHSFQSVYIAAKRGVTNLR